MTAIEELTRRDEDGLTTVFYRWLPPAPPRGLVHILHGWGEHAKRYDRPARALVAAGFAVYADDHRGHGETGLRNDALGDLGPRGMDGVLDAARGVTVHAAHEHPGVPVFVLGHSWGSMILQRYLRRWSDDLAGALLTGTTYRDPSAAASPRGSLTQDFEPVRTAYDWLSRDEAEVDLYIADPLCGFEIMRARPATSGASEVPEQTRPVRPSLPILVFNGAADPIGGESGAHALAAHYRDQGVADVTAVAYPGARHELFNETNRDEVVRDVIAWLDGHLP